MKRRRVQGPRPLFFISYMIWEMLLIFAVQVSAADLSNIKRGPRPDAWIETMSWKPRAFVWHGFLSDDEADHIRNLAEPRIARSSVVNSDGTTTPEHDIRTSYGTFLQ